MGARLVTGTRDGALPLVLERSSCGACANGRAPGLGRHSHTQAGMALRRLSGEVPAGWPHLTKLRGKMVDSP